jgi:hypothetical protein
MRGYKWENRRPTKALIFIKKVFSRDGDNAFAIDASIAPNRALDVFAIKLNQLLTLF